jgi:hypothetical protein
MVFVGGVIGGMGLAAWRFAVRVLWLDAREQRASSAHLATAPGAELPRCRFHSRNSTPIAGANPSTLGAGAH